MASVTEVYLWLPAEENIMLRMEVLLKQLWAHWKHNRLF